MILHEQVVARREGQVPWPTRWLERIDGWVHGLSYRLDWTPWVMDSVDVLSGATGLLVPERGVLGPPALIGPSRTGALLAFSAQAVNQAKAVWELHGVSTLYSPKWHVCWLNGLQSEGVKGFLAPWGMPGLDILDCGTFQLVFCPEVLGPLARMQADDNRQLEICADLDVRADASGLLVRGVRVFDGFWRQGRIEPANGIGGWLNLPGTRLW